MNLQPDHCAHVQFCRALQGVNALTSDHRTMAVAVFGTATGASGADDDVEAFVATAGSDASIKLLHLQVMVSRNTMALVTVVDGL